MLFFIISSWFFSNEYNNVLWDIPWNRKFYFLLDQERVVWFLLVSKGAHLNMDFWFILLGPFCFANTYQVCTIFPIFNELSKFFKVSPGHDDFWIFLLYRQNHSHYHLKLHQVIHQEQTDWAIFFLLFLLFFLKKLLNFSRTWFVSSIEPLGCFMYLAKFFSINLPLS